MIAFVVAAIFLLLFGAGVLRDRRRFGNAVYLGLAVTFLGLGLLAEIDAAPPGISETVMILVLLVLGLGPVVLAVLLCANGVKMVRKEGRRPANLLSLLAGLGMFGVMGLMVAAAVTHSEALGLIAVTTLLVVGYVSFLFLCFVGYAYLYGRMRLRRDADYVVVLGSGLIGGRRVPPLLASRLDRGRQVYETLAARGGDAPVLITSGGQGPDEALPESHAMADYLVERGFPAGAVVREDRSRTTEENMLFSKELMERDRPGSSCVIVTNNFHAFRAALMARRAGVDGQVVGSPTAAYFWPSATMREFVAVFLQYKVVNLGICTALILLGVLAWFVR
ncbi:YdcF family protein [Streptomyces gardneri]|uniref:Membrane protein n=1 Tax=Streptomyces gardneri TaxID=66892 RepID=A0A4Y3RLR1_9ACTN|nr:YdcF family protein [Streptomyces gardneri]GEB58781.1 membrane protein [Streptomyces gardneri]GHH07423.1 membrane protein [Streptomyces gardneri]